MAERVGVGFGLFVNNRHALVSSSYSLEELVRTGELADAGGFDFVSVGDSILAKPRFAPLSVLAYLAARTRRARLATGILRPHMRRPVPLAQEWTTLDRLSGGRTVLGVGIGAGASADIEKEHRLAGIPKARRGAAFDEWLTVLRRLWREERVTHHGEFLELDDVALGLEPSQRPHPPVVIAAGSYAPRAEGGGPDDARAAEAGTFGGPLDRVARLGDGWITGMATPEEYAHGLAHIRQRAEEVHGRTLDEGFRATLNCYAHLDDDLARARRIAEEVVAQFHGRPLAPDAFDRWVLHGPPDRVAERVAAYAEAGVRHIQFILADHDQFSQLERLQALGERMGALAPP